MKTTALVLLSTFCWAQQPAQPPKPPPPFSRSLFEVKQYTSDENQTLVAKFRPLRTTDVYDALQAAGLHKVTVMDREIGPMWTDNENFSHIVYGVAVTLRLVPPQEQAPKLEFTSNKEMSQWQRTWGSRHLRAGYGNFLTADTVLVIDAPIRADNGWCGSNNAQSWKNRGMRGIVTNAGCRDSDEMRKQGIPVYQRDSTRFINEGTIAVESYNTPVVVGGVLVMPGDIIIGDLDGVAVVPRAKAEVVAKIAHEIRNGDNDTRRKLYEKGGLKPDFTLK